MKGIGDGRRKVAEGREVVNDERERQGGEENEEREGRRR